VGDAAQQQLDLRDGAAGAERRTNLGVDEDAETLAEGADLLVDRTNEGVRGVQLQVLAQVGRCHLLLLSSWLELRRAPALRRRLVDNRLVLVVDKGQAERL